METNNQNAGVYAFAPKTEKQAEFVVTKLSIEVNTLYDFIEKNKEVLTKNEKGAFIYFDVLKTKDGKYYAKLNTFKPEEKKQNETTKRF